MSENKILTLAELKAEAANALTLYNRILNKPQNGDDLAKAEKTVDDALAAYNKESKRLVFASLNVAENPMLAAVKKLTYETISKKTHKNTITGAVTFVIDDGEKQIKLSEFDTFCEGKASADSKWFDLLREMCLAVTYKTCLDMGEKMSVVRSRLESTYYISHLAKDILNGKTPLSIVAMTKRLQTLVDAVVGENILKVISKDLAYVYTLMNKRGGCGIITSPRPQTMEELLMDVLHNIHMNKSYVVSYQQKKNAGSTLESTTDETETEATNETDDESV